MAAVRGRAFGMGLFSAKKWRGVGDWARVGFLEADRDRIPLIAAVVLSIMRKVRLFILRAIFLMTQNLSGRSIAVK